MFVLMVTGLVLWGATILGMRVNVAPSTALLWDRWAGVAITAMYLGFYHFALEYTNVFGPRRALKVGYALLAVFAISAPMGLLVTDLRVESYGYAPVPGPLAVPSALTAVALLLAGVYTLLRRYVTTSSYEERNRLLYLAVGAALPFIGSFLDLFTNLPPVGIWTNIAFCVISAIALLEYRLLDIPQVARRTLIYLVLGVMVAVPYVLTLILLNRVFGARMEGFWSYLVTTLFLALFLRPLYSSAQDVVNRLFYRNRYDALRALEQFGRDAQHEVDLDVLSCRLTRLVTEALHATRTCLFLPIQEDSDLQLVSCEGLQPLPEVGTFSARGALVRWLRSPPGDAGSPHARC